MLDGMPVWVTVLFLLTTLVNIWAFHRAARSHIFLVGLVLYTALQSTLAWSGFYTDAMQLPPRIMVLGILPGILFILACFATPAGRRFIDAMDLRALTWLHTVRIPVEVVLWMLVERQLLSTYMSVGGTNFDILSGLTAPVVAVLAFRGGRVHHTLLRVWNILALLLLVNVVVTAALGFPTPFQQHSFLQPNRAVLYFPMALLPTVVVPLVLLAHLAALRRLRK